MVFIIVALRLFETLSIRIQFALKKPL